MRIAILSIKSKTGKALAEKLDAPLFRNTNFETPDVLIRWGNTVEKETNKVLNKAKAITMAANKKKCREVLREAGIPVPEIATTMPCIARKERHRGGSGFWYCKREGDLSRAISRGAVYFSKLYPKTEEYRVHIAGGKCLLMSVKVGEKAGKIRWNKRRGFTFRHMHRSEWLETDLIEIVRMCKKAMKTIGLDFGAIDVGYNPNEEQKFVIFEINTTPSLSDLALQKYVEYFQEIDENV